MTGGDGRLNGWKAIGTFLGRDERTVRRWEVERGLPVHRVPGGGGAAVWAEPRALSAWMSGDDSRSPASVAVVPPAPRRRPRMLLAAGGAIALVAATFAWATLSSSALTAAVIEPCGSDAQANDLFHKASFGLSRRSVAGLTGATQIFEGLSKQRRCGAAAFVGLAETNLLLREFNSLPDEIAYRHAAVAAEAALKLDPQSATATRALAFVRYHGDGKRKEGLALFERAIALDASLAQSYHWYATALLAEGRTTDAARAFNRARTLDPGSSALAADAAYALYLQGKHVEAVAELRRIIDVDPSFSASYRYLARICLIEGRDAEYLTLAATDAKLRNDADFAGSIAQAAASYRTGGRKAMLTSLIAHEIAQFEQNGESALRVAMLQSAAGDAEAVVRWLERAESVNEPGIREIAAIPEFVSYRDSIKRSVALKSLIL